MKTAMDYHTEKTDRIALVSFFFRFYWSGNYAAEIALKDEAVIK